MRARGAVIAVLATAAVAASDAGATMLRQVYGMVSGFVGIWPDIDFLHDRPRIP